MRLLQAHIIIMKHYCSLFFAQDETTCDTQKMPKIKCAIDDCRRTHWILSLVRRLRVCVHSCEMYRMAVSSRYR